MNDKLASDARAPSHSVRSCLRDFKKHRFRDVGVRQFRDVVFVSMPVGRKTCLLDLSSTWFSFLWLFPSVVVLVHSLFDAVTSCVQDGKMRVVAAFHFAKSWPPRPQEPQHRTILMVWCLFCCAHQEPNTQASSISADVQHATLHLNFSDSRAHWLLFHLATSSMLRRSIGVSV